MIKGRALRQIFRLPCVPTLYQPENLIFGKIYGTPAFIPSEARSCWLGATFRPAGDINGIRQVVAIKDLSLYRKFVQLCAGRIGQPLNLTSLGNDVGVSHTTIREWISILEASYIAFLLPPYFANISKRLMKSPKLYFYDVGVATHLLKIRDVNNLLYHPLGGNLFENFVVSEILKAFFNRGLTEDLYFYREASGTEVDLMIGMGAGKYRLVEIKAGETVDASFFRNLKKVEGLLSAAIHSSAA